MFRFLIERGIVTRREIEPGGGIDERDIVSLSQPRSRTTGRHFSASEIRVSRFIGRCVVVAAFPNTNNWATEGEKKKGGIKRRCTRRCPSACLVLASFKKTTTTTLVVKNVPFWRHFCDWRIVDEWRHLLIKQKNNLAKKKVPQRQ